MFHLETYTPGLRTHSLLPALPGGEAGPVRGEAAGSGDFELGYEALQGQRMECVAWPLLLGALGDLAPDLEGGS